MAINFPTSLDSLVNKTDNVDDVMAVDVNDLNDATEALETKVGINSSAVATSLDYLVKNSSSSNPGHKHTLANGATDVTATKDEINSVADGSTAKNSHTHEITEGMLAASAVAQAKLKTSQGSVSVVATATNCTLPGGEYGFYPQIKMSTTGTASRTVQMHAYNVAGWTTYRTNIALSAAGAGTLYAQQRYVTSSGEVFWIFILRDKTTKEIIAMYQAPDHPCFGNGGKPLLVSHPFPDFNVATEELVTQDNLENEVRISAEIIVINPVSEELAGMRAKQIQPEDTPDKDLLNVITDEYEIDESSKPAWPTKEVTVGLSPDWDEAWHSGQPVTPIKKVIPKMAYIQCRKLKLK